MSYQIIRDKRLAGATGITAETPTKQWVTTPEAILHVTDGKVDSEIPKFGVGGVVMRRGPAGGPYTRIWFVAGDTLQRCRADGTLEHIIYTKGTRQWLTGMGNSLLVNPAANESVQLRDLDGTLLDTLAPVKPVVQAVGLFTQPYVYFFHTEGILSVYTVKLNMFKWVNILHIPNLRDISNVVLDETNNNTTITVGGLAASSSWVLDITDPTTPDVGDPTYHPTMTQVVSESIVTSVSNNAALFENERNLPLSGGVPDAYLANAALVKHS